MSGTARRRFLASSHQGLVLAPRERLSLSASFTNLALVAPTGSGKTTRYVIPNVLLAEGSVVVTDPSGEIFRKTSGHLRDRGFRVEVLNPAELSRSQRFNPLDFCQTPHQLRRLATILTKNGAGADPFWSISATNVLYVGLSALASQPDPRFATLGNLRWLLNHLGTENQAVDAFFSRYLPGAESNSTLFSEYVAFTHLEPKVKGSVLATARAALDLWSDRDVCRFTAGNSVAVGEMRSRPTAIYFILPEHQVRYFSILANLFYSICFQLCLESGQDGSGLPVFFLLDEFGNLGYVHDIATVITTLRKRRCSVSLILQEVSQLRAVYGVDEAHTILSGGCANKLYYSGLDVDTAMYVEHALGKNTEYDTTFGGVDHAARTLAVPLMYADQIRRLPRSEAILISGRERPVKLHAPPVSFQPELRDLIEKPPAPWPDDRGDDGILPLLDFGDR